LATGQQALQCRLPGALRPPTHTCGALVPNRAPSTAFKSCSLGPSAKLASRQRTRCPVGRVSARGLHALSSLATRHGAWRTEARSARDPGSGSEPCHTPRSPVTLSRLSTPTCLCRWLRSSAGGPDAAASGCAGGPCRGCVGCSSTGLLPLAHLPRSPHLPGPTQLRSLQPQICTRTEHCACYIVCRGCCPCLDARPPVSRSPRLLHPPRKACEPFPPSLPRHRACQPVHQQPACSRAAVARKLLAAGAKADAKDRQVGLGKRFSSKRVRLP
jgi:hypothetical protein